MASLKNLEAALLQLKGKALEHFGAIEILINDPAGISEHTNYVAEIITHAKGLSECEEAYSTLQTHFVPKAVNPPAPPAPPPEERPPVTEKATVVTAGNSPTMKRALKRTTSHKKKGTKQNEE
jgi:hypothetical protein